MAHWKTSKRSKARTVLRLPDVEQSKNAVLHSLAAASSQESHGHAIDEFIGWYCSEPRLSFNRTVVLRYRFFLEQKNLAASTINVRLAAVRRHAYEASDSGLLSPDLAAGIDVTQADEFHQFSGAFHLALLALAPAPAMLGQADVLSDCELRDDAQLLVDASDACRLGLTRISEALDLSVDRDFTGIGLNDPAEHVEQRALAGAVVPAQAVDLPRSELERHVADGADRAELFDEALHVEARDGGAHDAS